MASYRRRKVRAIFRGALEMVPCHPAEEILAFLPRVRSRRGSYANVDDFEGAVCDCLLHHNVRPKPFVFVWTKTAAEFILTR